MPAWYEDQAFVSDLYFRVKGVRLDAGETAAITRELTYIVKKTYDKKYPENKARVFLPVNYEIPEGAEFWTERGFDWFGMAKIITDYAADLPVVSLLAAEVVRGIKALGSAYIYSLDDLAKASFTGIPLDAKLAFAAKRAIENAIEKIAAVGNTEANLPGFLNNSNVPLLTAAGGDITGDWANATSDQIVADLNTIGNKPMTTTLGTYTHDTLLLPPDSYSLIMTKPYSDLQQKPVGRVFLESSPFIKNIDWWSYLSTANAAGNGKRAVSYKRDSETVELMITKEFAQLPPQAKVLAFIVNCWAKLGGVAIHYPLGVQYVDGI